MELSNDICCFCLCPNAVLTELLIKDEDGVTNFDRINLSLSKLAKILNENANYNYKLCYKCCDTLDMIHKFNQTCLHNIEKYLSQMKTIKIKMGTDQHNQIFEANDDEHSKADVNQFIKKETFSDFSSNNDFPESSNIEEVIVKPEIECISDYADLENFPRILTMEVSNIEGKQEFAEANSNTLINMIEEGQEYGEPSSQYQAFLQIASAQDKQKRFACEECNTNFVSKHNYERHFLSIHKGMKPFKCNICDTSFARKHHLSDHLLIHTSEKSHKCDVCEKTFFRKSNLETHKLIHSGNKPFSCDQCDKRFFQKGSLVKHKRVHTGEKPFKCDLCGVGFNDKSYLRIHHRVHTGEKPISCNICEKKFRKKSDFNRHKRVHNK